MKLYYGIVMELLFTFCRSHASKSPFMIPLHDFSIFFLLHILRCQKPNSVIAAFALSKVKTGIQIPEYLK